MDTDPNALVERAIAAAAAAPKPAPIVMDASSTGTAKAVGGTVLAAVFVVITALPTIAALVKAHSLVKAILWVQTTDGAGFISSASFLLATGWVIVKRLKLRSRALTAGRSADDRDVVVKNDVPTKLPSGTISLPSPPEVVAAAVAAASPAPIISGGYVPTGSGGPGTPPTCGSGASRPDA